MESASLLIFLDLSVAFDILNHGIVLEHLSDLGLDEPVLHWFHSLFSERFQKVVLEDSFFSPWPVAFGILSSPFCLPHFLNFCMKPLGEVKGLELRCPQCADVAQLYLSIPLDSQGGSGNLNRGLESVMGWRRTNKLKRNPDKTGVLV